MIAIDASALVAVIMKEDEQRLFRSRIARNDCLLGAPTLLEAQMVLVSRLGPPAVDALRFLVGTPTVELVEFTPEHAAIACDAFERYGGDRHPARLNFGDCMAYAVAKLAKAPLLFKGDDFSKTDIAAALPQGPK